MNKLDYALYSCDQIRACEQLALNLYALDEQELMLRAGTEAFFFLQSQFPKERHIAVFCGAGNNAGDGYILAKLAHEHGLSVLVYQCKDIEDLPATAREAARQALAAGVECQSAEEPIDSDTDIIVDALLGTGLKGGARGPIANAIHQINASGLPVLSLDIPSGLNADTGCAEGLAVQARMTLTFIGLKTGMFTLDGPDYCGTIACRDLKLGTLLEQSSPVATLLSDHTVSLPVKARKKNSHKGDYGHVLIIGGGPGMPGAVSLAAKAAMRVGAGAVTIATWPEHAKAVLPSLPEAMIWGLQKPEDLIPLLDRATVCVIGPGLGESDWARSLFLAAMRAQLLMVIDASALRLLAENPQHDDNWVLTPHPGEAASLLSCSSQEIQNDRYKALSTIQQQYGGVVVLKGTGTVIQTLDKKIFVCPKGNPGMASAGMGDVLSGIIAGLCAQGIALNEAAVMGVWIHAAAGDKAAQSMGEIGLLASDLLDKLPEILSCRVK